MLYKPHMPILMLCQGMPRNAKECPGMPRNAQECPGMPRNAQEYPGMPRNAQEYPGMPRNAQPGMPGIPSHLRYVELNRKCPNDVYTITHLISTMGGRHDTQHNGIQHNEIQNNKTRHNAI
jgi:hypothetical protein